MILQSTVYWNCMLLLPSFYYVKKNHSQRKLKLRLFTFIAVVAFIFSAGACGDGADPLAENGEACVESAECQSDDCRQEITGCHWLFGCGTIEFPGGMCTAECTWIEDTTDSTDAELLQADCEDGEQCLAPGSDPEATLCYQSCETDEDCRDDFVCTEISTFSTCLPPPDSSARVIETTRIPLMSSQEYKATR